MSYLSTIQRLAENPEELELTYQQAVKAGEQAAFAEAVETQYAESGANLLLAAWHYRLAHAAGEVKKRVIAWGWALPLGVLNGLLLWLLSDAQRFPLQVTNPLNGQVYTLIPLLLLLAAPVSAVMITLFLSLAGDRRWVAQWLSGWAWLRALPTCCCSFPASGRASFRSSISA